MGLRDRLTRRPRPGTTRQASSAELDHLTAWTSSRRGVEGFVEPQTSTTATTLVLVAGDGEWTRRRIVPGRGRRVSRSRSPTELLGSGWTAAPQGMREGR